MSLLVRLSCRLHYSNGGGQPQTAGAWPSPPQEPNPCGFEKGGERIMLEQLNDRYTTANARFKASFGRRLWGGVLMAVILHFTFFQFFPRLTAADFGYEPDWIKVLQPPELEIPPPPDPITRPRVPKVAVTDLVEDVTTAKTTPESNPIESLPPPPGAAVPGDDSFLTPYTVKPALKDPAKAARLVESLYPAMLRTAGIGGTVTVRAMVDTLGIVGTVHIVASSGHRALDQAALTAVRQFEFTPGMNLDRKVAVPITQAITFKVR